MPLTDFNNRKTLATLITRTVIWVVGLFTIGMLVQSWYLSRDIVREEVQRSSRQTSALVVNYFNYRLATLQILQDSNAKSDAVENFFQSRDAESLDYFFLREDNLQPTHTPDFRYITTNSNIVWDDGNALFYGLEENSLSTMNIAASKTNSWTTVSTDSQLGERHILLRRTPIVDRSSGEVFGHLSAGVILDDNAGLLTSLLRGSNSDDVVLTFGADIIASSISADDNYTAESALEGIENGKMDLNKILVTETPLFIGSQPSDITVYSIQRNPGVLALRNSYLFSILLSVVVIAVASVATRRWLNRKVTKELAKLMVYTKIAGDTQKFERFSGSAIHEFNHIGKTLSQTFERLSEQEKLFQDLFNFSLSPIIVWTEDSTILQINPAARKALGIQPGPDRDHGSSFTTFVEAMEQHVIKANHGVTITGIDVPIDDMVYRWNLSSIQTRKDKKLVLSQGQDITKLVEAEKQSAKARVEAERAAVARTEFMAKMSHEIRTPLNGILGISQLLKKEAKETRYQEQIDVLCNSGEHLLAVLNDILDFSKIENGSFKLEKHNFSFKEVANALDGIYRPLCDEKSIELVIDNQLPQETMLFTDQVRLNQILFNLVSNAIKFTHKGEVKVSFLLSNQRSEETAELHIQVEDTGIGIRSNQLEQIFDPFVQSESTLTREYGGSGLGLAIVRNLVTILDGDIQIQSEVGEGTQFKINLPIDIVEESEQTIAEETEIDFDLFNRELMVLLVEDNHTNAFIAKAFCEKYGMRVMWAKDGQEALDYIDQMSFDLVLMDNQLPSVSGIEITKKIRQDIDKSLPIYACTADNQTSTRQAFFAVGADFVIVKPIKEKSLNEALKHFQQFHYRAA
ncbi:quorum-sensing autoinducer 2 sensor kinase/phosphatase LuxQ [Vibrio maritimus]|uniref:quorum-sensing autoinducer 2 sensor kinase/phosphatase LuxQ n=1 Tax=Vibrio maritimus TaxID=990268 RepID=UPI003736B870